MKLLLAMLIVVTTACSRGTHNVVNITGVDARLTPSGVEIDADAEISLSQAIAAGVASGVPLSFILTADVSRSSGWNRRVLRQRFRYDIEFYDLTRHYRLTRQPDQMSRNFRSLLEALDYMGRIRGLELPWSPSALVREEADSGYHVRLALSFDINALPLPLIPQAVLSPAWRVRTGEASWPVQ